MKKARLVCRNQYVASNGERQNAYCFHIISFEGKPACRTALESFGESDVERLNLDVDRKMLAKLRALSPLG